MQAFREPFVSFARHSILTRKTRRTRVFYALITNVERRVRNECRAKGESVILLFIISNILILKYSSNIIKLFIKKNNFLTLRLSIRKATNILNKIIINIILKDRKIKYLYEELIKTKLLKYRKV